MKLLIFVLIIGVLSFGLVGVLDADAASGDPLLTINNPTPEIDDQFGTSVAFYDGGTDESTFFVVGAYNDNNGTNAGGSVYLFDLFCDNYEDSVKNDGICDIPLLTINNPTPDTDDQFGLSVATMPNGSIIVGAPGDDVGTKEFAGTVYMFNPFSCELTFGIPNGEFCNAPYLTIHHPTSSAADFFGTSVASTPDGNIIVGNSSDDNIFSNEGTVFLYDGTATGTISTPILTIKNPTPAKDDHFGISVASTPDGNIIVGSNRDTSETNPGTVYLFDGTLDTGLPPVLLQTINNPTTEGSFIDFGTSVASTPDGNIIVGARNDKNGSTSGGDQSFGKAHLFDGTTGNLLFPISTPIPAEPANFGTSVVSTPNGDLIISAPRDNTDGTNTGSVHLFDGTTGNLLFPIPNPNLQIQSFFGTSVASTPDGDILVGAPGDSANASNSGSVFLIQGMSQTPVITLLGDNPQIIEVGSGYTELGATTDDGSAVTIDALSFVDMVGTYEIFYDSTSSAGNAATTVIRTVNVVDTTAPVITLLGDNPQIIFISNMYDELGATASDNSNDPDISDRIEIDSSAVDTGFPGAYIVTYNVMDLEGNQAVQVERTVEVLESFPELFCGLPINDPSWNLIVDNRGNPMATLVGTTGPDLLIAGNNGDILHGLDGDDCLIGGGGFDIINGNSGDDFISGGSSRDLLYGGSGADAISGGAGDDFIFGSSGNDIINGGAGNDVILGSSGADIIDGEDGNDSVTGSAGNDSLIGGAGNDIVLGGSGTDTIDGGVDFDICSDPSDSGVNCEINEP